MNAKEARSITEINSSFDKSYLINKIRLSAMDGNHEVYVKINNKDFNLTQKWLNENGFTTGLTIIIKNLDDYDEAGFHVSW